MTHYISLKRHVFREIEQEFQNDLSLWREIPSSRTRRAVALLSKSNPLTKENVLQQRSAVADLLDRATRPSGTLAERSDPICEWLRRMSEPWKFGAALAEWSFLGSPARRELAKELIHMRNFPGSLSANAAKLVRYYSAVSDDELEMVMRWKPAKLGDFTESFLAAIPGLHPEVIRAPNEGRHFRIDGTPSQLVLTINVRRGVFEYSLAGLLGESGAEATYEGLLGIGLGEWDLVESTTVEIAASKFASIVQRLMSWGPTDTDTS